MKKMKRAAALLLALVLFGACPVMAEEGLEIQESVETYEEKPAAGEDEAVTEKDGWTVTVNNLPTRINGEPVTYSWTEQAVVYYTQDSVRQEGTTTFFTNKLWEKPLVPADQVPPKGRGDKVYVFDEYDTPLGVEVIINHVGDCFD